MHFIRKWIRGRARAICVYDSFVVKTQNTDGSDRIWKIEKENTHQRHFTKDKYLASGVRWCVCVCCFLLSLIDFSLVDYTFAHLGFNRRLCVSTTHLNKAMIFVLFTFEAISHGPNRNLLCNSISAARNLNEQRTHDTEDRTLNEVNQNNRMRSQFDTTVAENLSERWWIDLCNAY